MKMIPAENIKNFIRELEGIFYTLHLGDETWNQFDTITDLYFGCNLREIAQDNITEEIAIVWSIADVQSIRPDLTDEQASDVLKSLKRNHDATIGINWDLIEIIADDLFPEETPLTA
jgi:hypothetical protein